MAEHTLTGNIHEHPGFRSEILGNERRLLVYLPRGYRQGKTKRYPVLYLNDGQNLFDAATAFAGVEWGADETAQRLIGTRLIEPLIIVAVENTGENRIHEYTPTAAPVEPNHPDTSRGQARDYGRFLVEEVKPFIDRTYRTRSEPEATGLGGSSLGGLVTICLGLWFPHIFGRLAVISPSVWWDNKVILGMVSSLEAKLPLRIWLDTGTAEPGWEKARELRDALTGAGWRLDDDLHYSEFEGAGHDESAWGHRFEAVLRYLFPPPPPPVPRKKTAALPQASA